MTSRDLLQAQARRAYECGRLRAALKISVVIGGLAIVSAIETGEWTWVSVIGSMLLLVTVGLCWHHRRGTDDATVGLQAGAVPLLAALVWCRYGSSEAAPLAVALCSIAGVVGGVWIWRYARTSPARSSTRFVIAAGVAVLTACLGCVGLGLSSLGGVLLGLAAGSVGAHGLVAVRRTL